MDINILQYADDTVFFGTTTWENVRAIKVMLRSFELVSGLKTLPKIDLVRSGQLNNGYSMTLHT